MSPVCEPREIVIVGGGIIGCTTAYFLTRHPSYDASKHKITILEASKIAGGASGKAGGLLALWAYPKSIVPLSFDLHASLAKEHNGASRWGYRRLHVGQLAARGRTPAAASNGEAVHQAENDATRPGPDAVSLQKLSGEALAALRTAGVPEDLDWVDAESVRGYEYMGDPDNTAQVHPYQFTTAMAQLAEERGATVVAGRVTEILQEARAGVTGVRYVDPATAESRVLAATDVVLAAGPWTQSVYAPAPITALRAHSVTIRTKKQVSPYALFTDIELPGKTSQRVTPEIYARPDGEVYACGEGDQLVPLPLTTEDVQTDLDRCRAIVEQVGSVSRDLREGEVTARQACYLPNVEGPASGPLIGRAGVKGLFIAAGHTCWGIQNGPGTGKLMSEFVFEGEAKSAKIGGLDPVNFL